MKNSLCIAFCLLLTSCGFLQDHPEIAKDVKAVEVKAIDDIASDLKQIVSGPSGATGTIK